MASGDDAAAATAAEEQRRAEETARLAELARQRAAALDKHETAHEALWVQATTVVNIKALIRVTLESATNNFSKWHGLFLMVLGKYALTPHILSDDAMPDRPIGVQMDCTVLTWLYGTVSNELL